MEIMKLKQFGELSLLECSSKILIKGFVLFDFVDYFIELSRVFTELCGSTDYTPSYRPSSDYNFIDECIVCSMNK